MAKTEEFVLRPFEGLPSEPDWVAFREVVPSATATAKTSGKYGGQDILVCTLLPDGVAAMKKFDGTVLLGLQGALSTGDLSRDLAAALLEALDAEPGTAITGVTTTEGPRLQDVLDLKAPFEVTVYDTYGAFWNEEDAEEDEDADMETLPTERLKSIDHAYLTTMNKPFLRWARLEDEDDVVAAIARLHAKRESAVKLEDGGEGRFLGMFRAAGLTVPVWEFPDGTTGADLEKPMAAYAKTFDAALKVDEPLNADERRAKAGIISRQVTLR